MNKNLTNKELAHEIINGFSDDQLDKVITILESLKSLTDEQKDDKFCKALYNDYLQDSDENKHDAIPLKDFAEELGIDI